MLLHTIAQAYGQRPSTLLRGSWDDYQIDVAVFAAAHAPARPAAPPPGRGLADLMQLAPSQGLDAFLADHPELRGHVNTLAA